jgi:hypothetical protein
MLHLVLPNISDFSSSISSSVLVTPDRYNPLVVDFRLTLDSHRISLTPHRSYVQGDYLLLCNVWCHSDWSCVLNENSVDSTLNTLTAIVHEAVNLAIPYTKSKNSTFPHWLSDSLKYYIKKKSTFQKIQEIKIWSQI